MKRYTLRHDHIGDSCRIIEDEEGGYVEIYEVKILSDRVKELEDGIRPVIYELRKHKLLLWFYESLEALLPKESTDE